MSTEPTLAVPLRFRPMPGCTCGMCRGYSLGFAAGQLAAKLEEEDRAFVAAGRRRALLGRLEIFDTKIAVERKGKNDEP